MNSRIEDLTTAVSPTRSIMDGARTMFNVFDDPLFERLPVARKYSQT